MKAYGPYPAVVTAIHDGDTLTVDIDLGFGIHQTGLHCRLYSVNAPELATLEGKAALVYIQSILPIGSPVSVTSFGWDKYGGRFDGRVFYGPLNIGAQMIASGNAVPMAPGVP